MNSRSGRTEGVRPLAATVMPRKTLNLRASADCFTERQTLDGEFEKIFNARIREADEFYLTLIPDVEWPTKQRHAPSARAALEQAILSL